MNGGIQPTAADGAPPPESVTGNRVHDAEPNRALEDPDPLRGIAQLTGRWAAAFVLDPHGITRTKTLGTERMARKLADRRRAGRTPSERPSGCLRPMLSPQLATLHRDAFVFDERVKSSIEVAADRGKSDLADLDLGADAATA